MLKVLIPCYWFGGRINDDILGRLSEFRFYRKLDEREKDIYIKAMIFSFFVFVGFWFVFAFSAFFITGGGGAIPVGILPMMLLASILVAQGTKPLS